MSSGGWLQGDLDWLAMGGDWKSCLFGERAGLLLWGLALCHQDRVGPAGSCCRPTSFPALKCKHYGHTSQRHLASFPLSLEVEMVCAQK